MIDTKDYSADSENKWPPQEVLTQLKRLGELHNLAQILASVVFPVFEAMLVPALINNSQFGTIEVIFIIVLIMHVLCVVVSLRTSTPLPKYVADFNSIANSLHKHKDELISYKHVTKTYEMANIATLSSLEQIRKMMNSEQQPSLESLLFLVMEPWVMNRDNIFWYKYSCDFYNFAVYLYCEKDDYLKKEYRYHHPDLPVSNRSWKKSEGYIGTCFAKKEPIITVDATSVDFQKLIMDSQTSDSEYYKGFIASPIWIEDKVIGVTIVTTNRKDQFEELVHKGFVEILSHLIEMALITCWKGDSPWQTKKKKNTES